MTSATDYSSRPTAPAPSAGMPPAISERALGRRVVGGFFLVMGGVHLGLVAADPQVYDGFADRGLFAFVRDGWQDVVMAQPALYGLLLMGGEIVLGTALLVGGRVARIGWMGVITFHVLLVVFGWWIWVWAVPALAVLVPLSLHDLRRTENVS